MFLLIALLSNFYCGEAVPQAATIKINPQQKFQTITGWEATADLTGHFSPAFKYYKEKLLDAAANDLGINRIRLEVRSGIENPVDYFAQWRAGQITENEFEEKRYESVNDNSDPDQINADGFKWSQVDDVIESVVLPLRERLRQRGEKLWINVNYVDFHSPTGIHRKNPREYAEFILATYLHIQSKYRFIPDSWEVILEPDNANWSAVETADAIKAAGDLLKAHGFTAAFVAPSTTNAANAPIFIDQIAETPGAMQYVSEFSYHRYCCASEEILQAIAARAARYGKQTAMLEWIGADYKTLHEDLKIGRNSAWQQYTLAYSNQPDNGAQYYVLADNPPGTPTLKAGSRTSFLRQYFRYVRAGAQRVEAESANANFDPLAFINADGGYVLVVKANAPGTVSVEGFPAGTYCVGYTTANQSNTDEPQIRVRAGEILSASIPAAGVLTIFARNSAVSK